MCSTGTLGPWIQHGVVSGTHAEKSCADPVPTINVRISYYNQWIKQQIKLLSTVNQ